LTHGTAPSTFSLSPLHYCLLPGTMHLLPSLRSSTSNTLVPVQHSLLPRLQALPAQRQPLAWQTAPWKACLFVPIYTLEVAWLDCWVLAGAATPCHYGCITVRGDCHRGLVGIEALALPALLHFSLPSITTVTDACC